MTISALATSVHVTMPGNEVYFSLGTFIYPVKLLPLGTANLMG